jgi:uncharacterized iron-regulated membrane protein
MPWTPLRVFRSILFWLHLVAGISTAVIVVIMSVTGVVLTYQRQMQYWADTRHYRAEPAPGQERLLVEDLVARVESALPVAESSGEPPSVSTVTYRADPDLPVAVAVANRTLYVNPYTGELHGEGAGQAMRSFFSSMVGWHRWLAMSGDGRTTGRAITGAANLLFLFIVLSGLYLWWPRLLTWTQFRNITWFRRGLQPKARDFNWHNVLGFWSAIPLALVVYSGVVISYPWASNSVYRMMGEEPPVRGQQVQGVQEVQEVQEVPGVGRLSVLFMEAAHQVADWNILALRVPATDDAPLIATIDRGNGGQPHLRATMTLNPAATEIVDWSDFSDQTPGRQMRSILRFAHTGEAGGLTGQTIAGLVSAASVVLVYTGLALSWRRLVAWIRRRRRTSGNGAGTEDVRRVA